MTFTEVSAKYHDSICALVEGIHDKFGMYHTRTHYSNNPHIMWILHPGSTREISGGIGAPVAAKSNNFRLKTHVIYSFLSRPVFICRDYFNVYLENPLHAA